MMQSKQTSVKPPKTLIFSSRGVVHWLSTSCFYEFEDLISDWMDAEILAPADRPYLVRKKLRGVAYRFLRSTALAESFSSPALAPYQLAEDYDLLFATLPDLFHTYKLADYRNLRERCGKMVCYIPEVWIKHLREKPYIVAPLRQFDQLFVSTLNPVELVQEMTGVPCNYLPFAVDAHKFSPFPFFPERHIDVLSIGRRSPVTHEALLKAMDDKGLYYSYDTVLGFDCRDAREHRTAYANMAKRAKYFISNTANFDQLFKTGGAVEIGHRFYEGAAAGAVLLGHYPDDHEVIRAHFDWPDAIVKTDYDAANIVDIIKQLNAKPDRLLRARTANVRNCLLRHDFVYRWEEVLKTVGYAPTAKMQTRKTRLEELADDVQSRLTEKETSREGASSLRGESNGNPRRYEMHASL